MYVGICSPDNMSVISLPVVIFTFANVVGRMLCIHPRLSVCLFVCLLAGLLKKLSTDLNEI